MEKKLESEFSIIDWWKKVVIDNYANFEGRARRKEYWMFQLTTIIIVVVFVFLTSMVTSAFGDDSLFFYFLIILFGVYVLLILIPSLAVSVRRLHDTNRSGWFYLISFIPYIGGLISLMFYVSEGTTGKNRYGHDPKRMPNEINEIGVSEE